MAERSELHYRTVCGGGSVLLKGLFSTVRFLREGEEHYRALAASGQQILYAFWHARLLSLVTDRRDEGIAVLISLHSDGEYIARVIDAFGFRSVRGSSTRGGAKGARSMLKAAREGRDMAVTPDGPKGPPREIKDGLLFLARLTGCPLIPIGTSASRAWRASSWDRFLVPKPFSRVSVVYGEPIWIPRDLDAAGEPEWTAKVEAAVDAVTDRADVLVGREPGDGMRDG
jgi:lysophospholipid acyltransferase (LPLAT)-like uncharacterized protein